MPDTQFIDLGVISYKDAFEYQENIFNRLVKQKLTERSAEVKPEAENYFIFCEHPHVITLGKSGDPRNLLFSKEMLEKKGIEYFPTNRGGDITYHGPGQIVGYPILDLESFGMNIHSYIESLEEVIIRTCANYGIIAGRLAGMTGVWLDSDKNAHARKICAIGVKASRHITMHGFAFNINTDLNYFNFIVPCGITGKEVTSLSKEKGITVSQNEVKAVIKSKFEEVFGK